MVCRSLKIIAIHFVFSSEQFNVQKSQVKNDLKLKQDLKNQDSKYTFISIPHSQKAVLAALQVQKVNYLFLKEPLRIYWALKKSV